MYEILKNAKINLIKAQNMKAGVENAKQSYINLLFNNESQILQALGEIDSLKKQIAELKEENELLNKTLEEQDKKLTKRK